MTTNPGVTLKSGAINASSGFTPTGGPMKVAVDNPYCTKDDFIQSFEARGLGITVNDPAYSNGELDAVILEASAYINAYCSRWFDTQTIDETTTGFQVRPYNPQMVTNVMKNRPFQSINSIYIQVLQWFIQVDTTQTGYLQIFPDKGFYRIVPLLSSAGTGIGSPIPAAILDRVALGVLWTNYTFGYGTSLKNYQLNQIKTTKQYQAALGNRLWAPDQTLVVRDNNVVVSSSNYTVDYPNGMITFISTYTVTGPVVSADFTTNQSIPAQIKKACILMTMHFIGQALQNPIGASSYNIQTFSVNFGELSKVEERAQKLLEAYSNEMPVFMGF